MSRRSDLLVETDWLAEHLHDSDLRILECTVYLHPADVPGGYRVESGRWRWEQGHIPEAGFADLQDDLSDRSSPLRFTLPPAAQFADAMGRYGVGPGVRVVLYDRFVNMWAARIWWMLRAFGFDGAAVLNGGFDAWKAQARPTESGPARGYPPGDFKAAPRPGFFVDKHATLAAAKERDTAIVNALGPQFHKGQEPSRYGRPGRIPGSVNVPAASVVDGNKNFVTLEDAEAKFAAQGVTKDKRVICYCGGGISATIDLFLLHQLGFQNLTLYDGSMGEWAKDPSLPIETG